MADSRFFTSIGELSVDDALALIVDHDASASIVTGSECVIDGIAATDDDQLSSKLVYCASKSSCEALDGRDVGAVIVSRRWREALSCEGAIIEMDDARLGCAIIAAAMHTSIDEDVSVESGGKRSKIHPSARIHEQASLGAGVEIGEGVSIGPFCHIGAGVIVGDRTRIDANVTITHAIIGADTSILAGARIGQAGFGFVGSARGMVRVPQLGRVLLGRNVEIGANTTIDRGTIGDTILDDGVKLDNSVQIAHNVRIGKNCVFAALSGVSGSVTFGDNVMVGGQSGFASHIRIGDNVKIAAQSGVMHDIPNGETWGGSPAKPRRVWMREIVELSKLAQRNVRKMQD